MPRLLPRLDQDRDWQGLTPRQRREIDLLLNSLELTRLINGQPYGSRFSRAQEQDVIDMVVSTKDTDDE